MAERVLKRTHRKPSFLWQGVLILAPVLVLASIGSYALWKDQRLALREAEMRGQELAERAVAAICDTLQMAPEGLQTADADASQTPLSGTRTLLKQSPPAKRRKTKALNILTGFSISAPQAPIAIDPEYGSLLTFDPFGNLLFPKPYAKVPTLRPLDQRVLSPEQRRLWEQARKCELAGFAEPGANDQLRQASALYEQFLQLSPSADFAALAHFHLGLVHERNDDQVRAAAHFMTITNRYPSAMTESGLPLDLLARARIQSRGDFLAYALDHPCAVTADIIKQKHPGTSQLTDRGLDNSTALSIWNEQEQLRDIAEAARAHFQTKPPENEYAITNGNGRTELSIISPAFFWVTLHEDLIGTNGILTNHTTDWLLTRREAKTGFELVVLGERALKDLIRESLGSVSRPGWLDFTVAVAGRPVIGTNQLRELQFVQGGKGGGQFWHLTSPATALPSLATAGRRVAGEPFVSVSAMLVSRALLLAQQKERTTWFGLLIAMAAGGAVIGFVSAYRGFHKQHRLAEMKSNFVSGVSHELRAPIASIRLLAEGLERGKISEPVKQHEYFRFIVQECRRLSSMIENVLDFARIEQGRKQYEFESTDVMALVEQTVRLMQPYAAERGVGLDLRKVSQEPEQGPSDSADSNQFAGFTADIDGQAIQQALVNLVDNAIKHSPDGEKVLVTLQSRADDATPGIRPPGPSLHLSVEDHGPGIPAGEHGRIFERFYRLGSELRRETQGVGIGLSIVKHIVEAHHGSVSVESQPGKGSRFTIKLPLHHDETAKI